MNGLALDLLWYGQVGVGADGGGRDGAMDQVEESVFFTGRDEDGTRGNGGWVREEGSGRSEDYMGSVGIYQRADGAYGSGGSWCEEDIAAVSGGAVMLDTKGAAVDALEGDGAAGADVGETRSG